MGGACAPLPVHSAPPSPPGRGRGQGPQVSRASQGRQRPRVPGQERAARKGSLPGRLTTEDSTAVRERRPRPFSSTALHCIEVRAQCPGSARSPPGPQVSQKSAPVRTSPECPQQHGCPSSWETRGRLGARASGEDSAAGLGPSEETRGAEGRAGVPTSGCEDRSSPASLRGHVRRPGLRPSSHQARGKVGARPSLPRCRQPRGGAGLTEREPPRWGGYF